MKELSHRHKQEAHAIIARVEATLAAIALRKISQLSIPQEPLNQPAVPEKAAAAVETSVPDLAPETQPEPGFGPEPDGALEVLWAEPETVPPWSLTGQTFSEIDADAFSAFRCDEAAEQALEAQAVAVTAEIAETAQETEPPLSADIEAASAESVSAAVHQPEMIPHVEEYPVVAVPCALDKPRFSRRAAFMAMLAAAVITITVILALCLGNEPEISAEDNDPIIIIDVDENENRPLVDLTAYMPSAPYAREAEATPEDRPPEPPVSVAALKTAIPTAASAAAAPILVYRRSTQAPAEAAVPLDVQTLPIGKNSESASGAVANTQSEAALGKGVPQDSDIDAQLAAALGLDKESL
jgi:hypothetical protein